MASVCHRRLAVDDDDLLYPLEVFAQLLGELYVRSEAVLGPNAAFEVQMEILVVDIVGKIENMHLQRALALMLHRRATAYIGHASILAVSQRDARSVSSVKRKHLMKHVDIQIGSRKSQLAS